MASNSVHAAGPTYLASTTISSNTTWTAANSPYILNGNVTIASAATLTIEPGVVVKLNGTSRKLNVRGTLKALGTSSDPIIFTSIQDDSVAGDSGGDGPTSGGPGQWYQIDVESGNSDSIFRWTEVRYGGYGSSSTTYGGIKVRSGSVPTLDHASIVDNQRAGISVGGGSGVVLRDSLVARNRHGVYAINGWVDAERTTIRDNYGHGLGFSLSSSYSGPDSAINRNDITSNDDSGIAVFVDHPVPASSIPRGNFNNIFDNTDARQMSTPQTRREIDWTNNYWGEGVRFAHNPLGCENAGQLSRGRLTFPGGGDGPLTSSSYPVGSGQNALTCHYDKRKVDPGEFFTSPIAGSGAPLEQLLGSGMHAVNPSGHQSDPVNSATGSFFSQEADLLLPGIDVPFVLRRSYNSMDGMTGALGLGWRHSLETSLKIWPHGDVKLTGEDGQRVTYEKKADGSFAGGIGSRSKLAKVTGGYELMRKDQVVYRFDNGGKLMSIKGRNDRGLTLSYGADGNVSVVTDSVGRIVTFTHTGGKVTKVELPDGRFTAYGYTGGVMTSVTDLRGGTITYVYNAKGWLTSKTDQNNNIVYSNTYATSGANEGRVTAQTDARGNTSTFSWSSSTQTSTMTDNRGNPWKDVYSSGKLVSRIDPLGNSYHFGYDSDLNINSVTDPRGKVTALTYDSRGNLLTRAAPAPLVHEERFSYNSRNDPTSHTDGRGNKTTLKYDSSGNLNQIQEPGSMTTHIGRDLITGLITSVTDPRLKSTSLAYDSSGNLTSVTRPSGAETTFGYDSSGRMISLVEARGNATGTAPADYTWSFSYDSADHLRSVIDPLGNKTEWSFDPAGNLDWVEDAKLRTIDYTYFPNNLLKKVVAPDLTETVYDYDKTGNLISITDANQHSTAYTYDGANRVESITLPNGQEWSYTYDKNGNVKTVTDAEGNATVGDPSDGTITITYDVLNRVKSLDYSDSTPGVSFTYDANSNRTTMIDGAGTESYQYDDLNRLTDVIRGSQAFAYEYDESSNVTKRSYPDGSIVDYTYDDDGFVGSVTTGGRTITYSYNAAGLLKTTDLPALNGHTETRSYDRAGRLTSVENARALTMLSSFDYGLDEVGNPETITDSVGNVTSYQYDPDRDFLTEVCLQATCPGSSDPFIRYEYDPVGNRTKEIRPSRTDTYTYDASDRLQSVTDSSSTTAFSFDRNGNMTQAGAMIFSYDLANRMRSASDGATTITYAYDGDGKRLSASSGTQPADTTKYVWDPNWPLYQLVREEDDSGSLIRRYVHGNDLISMTTGGSDYYFHHDGLGSVTNLTSELGLPQWSYSYEPFGGLRTETQVDLAAPDNVMRFTGELFDADTKKYHLRARQYDPVLGRFMQPDPWPTALSIPYLSTYHYVGNIPSGYVDPTGLFAWVSALIGGGIGFVSGVTGAAAQGASLSEVLITGFTGAGAGFVSGGVGIFSGVIGSAFLGGVANSGAQYLVGGASTQLNVCSVIHSFISGAAGGAVGRASDWLMRAHRYGEASRAIVAGTNATIFPPVIIGTGCDVNQADPSAAAK